MDYRLSYENFYKLDTDEFTKLLKMLVRYERRLIMMFKDYKQACEFGEMMVEWNNDAKQEMNESGESWTTELQYLLTLQFFIRNENDVIILNENFIEYY